MEFNIDCPDRDIQYGYMWALLDQIERSAAYKKGRVLKETRPERRLAMYAKQPHMTASALAERARISYMSCFSHASASFYKSRINRIFGNIAALEDGTDDNAPLGPGFQTGISMYVAEEKRKRLNWKERRARPSGRGTAGKEDGNDSGKASLQENRKRP